MTYRVSPYKVARFQNSLMRKVASSPRLRKQATLLPAVVSGPMLPAVSNGVGRVISNIFSGAAKLSGSTSTALSRAGQFARPVYGKVIDVTPDMIISGGNAAKKGFKWLPWLIGGGATAAAAGAGIYAANQQETPAERIKRVLLSYSPYVGGGAALGALLGGGIGYANDNTLAGSLIGGAGGAVLGGVGKALYDKYKK